MRYLYMAVTPDEYELPLAVEETVTELASKLGAKRDNLSSNLSKGRSGKNIGYKIVKVKIKGDLK